MTPNRTAFTCARVSPALLMLMLCSCDSMNRTENSILEGKGGHTVNIKQAEFGKTPTGEVVDVFTLTNANGLECRIITYGGTCISLKVPDREGRLGDILLGHDSLDGYYVTDPATRTTVKGKDSSTHPYFGVLVGRYGNRIAGGKFTLDGTEYTLATNNNDNHLHGGNVGFDQKIWHAEPIKSENEVSLKLMCLSPDGEEGYPGTLSVTVTYTLTNRNELRIDYRATTDKPTVCNLTNHNYYNLTCAATDILGHELLLNADQTTPVDAGLIPTGEIVDVAGGPFDFRTSKAIGQDIEEDNQQLGYGPGYDHNWILNKEGKEMSLAAEVYEPTTGRVMTIYTTEPAIQFYAGNFRDGSFSGKGDIVYQRRYGFCLETQHSPDSPNKADWPSTTLRPGEIYETSTMHKFSIR